MSHLCHFNYSANLNPQPLVPTSVGIMQTPHSLMISGFNLLIEVTTASAIVNQARTQTLRRAIPVMAHFDTGASLTTIDAQLATHLGIISTGSSPISTANGIANTPNYAVDVSFINTPLKSIVNLQVSSCNLAHFNLSQALSNPSDPRNFGVLIGRDIMSLWNIVWNGPTSTVLISD